MSTKWSLDDRKVAPAISALLSADYPVILQVQVPPLAQGVVAAWRGPITPFSDDNSAVQFLRAMVQGHPVPIGAGTLYPKALVGEHWSEPLLVHMAIPCELLILQAPAPAHLRAYLLSPLYDLTFLRRNEHPHPRQDLTFTFEGKDIVGLCVYSASEFKYEASLDRATQFLDQVTMWVARHLIWLKVRRLCRFSPEGGIELRSPGPGEDLEIFLRPGEYWRGEWFGPRARATTATEHFSNISPLQECWCGSGKRYSDCHRAKEEPQTLATPGRVAQP